MGGGRSWSPGRALPRVGQTAAAAAAGAAVSPHLPSFPSLPYRAWPPSPTSESEPGEREPDMALTVDVVGPGPWGFRITGGRDFHTPIMVTKGSVRTHTDSQSSLRSSCSSPVFSSPQPGSPFSALPPTSPQALPGETVVSRSFQSLAHSPGLAAADRFSYGGHPRSRPASLTRAAAGDSAVLVLPPSPGPHSSSPRLSVDSEGGSRLLEEDSEVYKMLQENREGRVAPRQSSSFRLLQEALEAEERGGTPAFLPSSLSPQSSLPTSRALATPPKLHTCEKCSTSIVNQAVRIQEGRYRHPGCYTCADCGLNLKMRGHFWVGDELYCEKHARQRYSSPPALSSHA
ncbi:PDZ and LIM domain protein 2 isoform X4 [Lynx rufus]|uniref:PDZ and LIM domain protein 2 isoform X4 n=1 Tax=Lynx rufus TaxID=61384 RepID=UPI001F124561|nr:PDZ and LIM domain protein 2 isoform X4 [Lynx rufus]